MPTTGKVAARSYVCYSIDMTMKRSEKAGKTGMIQKILGGHKEPAHSPKLRAAMIADHGKPTYTAGAWIANRLRHSANRNPESQARERATTDRIRGRRAAGTRRAF
jgi:hypothetical protein